MAKGRKSGADRRDRLLGTYGFSPNQESGGDAADLSEEDVWSAGGVADSDPADPWPSSGRHGRPAPPPRWAGRGGLSLAFEDGYSQSTVLHQYRNADSPAARGGGERRRRSPPAAAASAPVNVPDWGRILRVESIESIHASADEGDDYGEWVPPHEYVAREHARMSAATSSVLEGVGRTLKGRDMSRVRDAVWSQTGFFG